MKRTHSLRWLNLAVIVVLAACAGEPAAPQLATQPQFSGHDNNGVGPGQEHEPFPDLAPIAVFKRAAPPSRPATNHAVIGPAGGSLRVGDFDIVVPRGAVGEKFGVYLADKGITGRAIAIVDRNGTMAWFKNYDIPTVPDIKEVADALAKVH